MSNRIVERLKTPTTSLDDSMINEPTRQPVSVRRAVWQSKFAVSETDPSMTPLQSRINNFEKKATGQTRMNLRSSPKVDLHRLANTATMPTVGSPSSGQLSRGPSAMQLRAVSSNGSPVNSSPRRFNSGTPSPQKLAPATQSIQDKLVKLCESRAINDTADRERQARATEIASLEQRWKNGILCDGDETTTKEVANTDPTSVSKNVYLFY